ncbi:MAG: ATP-binding protein, partial [Thermoplasmatota archaeon]
ADHVQAIREGSARLLSVVGDVLDYSRMEVGQLPLEERAFEVAPLVAGCLKTVSVAAVRKGLGLTSHSTADVPAWLLGDPTRVRQVLLNLLSNAVKFTPAGSIDLAVSARREGDRVRVEFQVSDTGVGIPTEQVRHLFRPFIQVGSVVQGGTGLGLAISRHLCGRMGGDILVRSRPGSGSTFTAILRLPRASPEAVEAVRAEASAPVPPGRTREVLLVEDNSMNLRLSRKVLERLGHRVEVATDGAQAVAMVRGRRYGAVLLDVHMPIMDGLQAAREICRQAPQGRPLLIGLTATPEDRVACLRAGMDGHLSKPLDPARLTRLLADLEAPPKPGRKESHSRSRAVAVAN